MSGKPKNKMLVCNFQYADTVTLEGYRYSIVDFYA
jgi:hypothetical protein